MVDQTQVFRRKAAPRFDTSVLGTLAFGSVLAVAFIWLTMMIPRSAEPGDTLGGWLAMLREKSLDRGPVQLAIIVLFWWALAFLIQKGVLIWQLGAGAFHRVEEVAIPRQITPHNAWDVVNAIGSTGNTIFDFRLRRGLQIISEQGDSRAAASFLNGQASADEEAAFRSYAFLRFAMWAMPILGFIGTVVGIGTGVGSFSASISSTEVNALRDSLTGVTGGLTMAFDTTLAGLVATTIVTGIYTLMLRREQNILGVVDSLLRREVISRLTGREDAGAESGAAQASSEMTNAIVTALERLPAAAGGGGLSEEQMSRAIEKAVRGSAEAFGQIGATIEQAGTVLASAIVARFDESVARIQAEHRKLTDRLVETAAESFQKLVDSQGSGMAMHLARMKELAARAQQVLTLQTEAVTRLSQTERAQLADVENVHRSLQAVFPLLSGLSRGFQLMPLGAMPRSASGSDGSISTDDTMHDDDPPPVITPSRPGSGERYAPDALRTSARELAPETPRGTPLDLNADFGEMGPVLDSAFPGDDEDQGARPASSDAWAETITGAEAEWSDSDGLFSGADSPFADSDSAHAPDAMPADESDNGSGGAGASASPNGANGNGSGPRTVPSGGGTVPADPFAGADEPFDDDSEVS